MAKWKRRRPKNRRAGCLLCNPRKANGASPSSMYSMGEARRLGGRGRRMSRHDVGWAFEDEGEGEGEDGRGTSPLRRFVS